MGGGGVSEERPLISRVPPDVFIRSAGSDGRRQKCSNGVNKGEAVAHDTSTVYTSVRQCFRRTVGRGHERERVKTVITRAASEL